MSAMLSGAFQESTANEVGPMETAYHKIIAWILAEISTGKLISFPKYTGMHFVFWSHHAILIFNLPSHRGVLLISIQIADIHHL